MKLLAFVISPSIYHGCSTSKMFWEGKFTLGEFAAVNTKTFGGCNIRKHREIKSSDNYVALDISLKFDILDKMRIKYSNPKDNLGRSGKGLITSLGITSKARPHKYKKTRYAIINVNMRDLSKIIRDFEKLPYKSYERRRPKNEPNGSYFYLSRQLVKYMMRADVPNSYIYPVRTEITATKDIPILQVCSTDKSKLKKVLS